MGGLLTCANELWPVSSLNGERELLSNDATTVQKSLNYSLVSEEALQHFTRFTGGPSTNLWGRSVHLMGHHWVSRELWAGYCKVYQPLSCPVTAHNRTDDLKTSGFTGHSNRACIVKEKTGWDFPVYKQVRCISSYIPRLSALTQLKISRDLFSGQAQLT